MYKNVTKFLFQLIDSFPKNNLFDQHERLESETVLTNMKLNNLILCSFMGEFPECPNCVKDRLSVPLRFEGDSLVCPLCESVYGKTLPKK